MNAPLYERDFHAWANEQAALLRTGQLDQADIAHIAEEIESMGKTQKHELKNRLVVLLLHLLKWQYQSCLRSMSWRITISNQRLDIADHLAENPSLKSGVVEILATAYDRARKGAHVETDLPLETFPPVCPWSFEQAMDPEFWPDPVG